MYNKFAFVRNPEKTQQREYKKTLIQNKVSHTIEVQSSEILAETVNCLYKWVWPFLKGGVWETMTSTHNAWFHFRDKMNVEYTFHPGGPKCTAGQTQSTTTYDEWDGCFYHTHSRHQTHTDNSCFMWQCWDLNPKKIHAPCSFVYSRGHTHASVYNYPSFGVTLFLIKLPLICE